MDDRSLYETILGVVAPWYVAAVELRPDTEEVWVRLERREEVELVCPECQQVAPGYDRAEERRWRHLDTCQYRTVLSARVPRVQCPAHDVHHRVTNAMTEALNAKIQQIRYRARGYRNRENFRLAILFHCGGLEMNPR